MNLSNSIQSVKDIVRFPFLDPKWQNKLLIGSLLGFAGYVIPVVPMLPLMGYLARVLRAGARNDDPTRLPEWEDWGDLFMDGLRMFGVTFLISLPSLVIMLIGWVIYMVGTFSMSSARNSYDVNSALGPFFISLGVFMLSMAVGLALWLVAMVILPPAMSHVAVKRRFSALFEFSRWWGILRANFFGFVVALGVAAAVYMVMVFAMQILYMTIIFCVLIPFVLMPISVYMGIVLYRLFGQAYGEVAPGEVSPEPVRPVAPVPPVAPVTPVTPTPVTPVTPVTPAAQSPFAPVVAATPTPEPPAQEPETAKKSSGLETIILPRVERKEDSSGLETIILPREKRKKEDSSGLDTVILPKNDTPDK